LLWKLKDANDLAEKMRTMTEFSNDKLIAMGSNGRKKMEKEFDETIVINKYLGALTALKPV
jgi:hypothetical protein